MKSETINTNEYEKQIMHMKMKIDSINYVTESGKEKIKMMLDDMSKKLIKEEMTIWDCLK